MHPTLHGGGGVVVLYQIWQPTLQALLCLAFLFIFLFFLKQHILEMALLLVYREIPYLLLICIYLPYSVDVWIP